MIDLLVAIPCLRYFKGVPELIHSIETDLNWRPFIIDNWRQNRGVSKSWNMAIEKAQSGNFEFLIICNDDITFAPFALDYLVSAFRDAPDNVQMVTAQDYRDSMKPEEIFSFRPSLNGSSGPHENPNFSAFMIRPDFSSNFGPFDANFWPAYFEDNDMHYRMKLAGSVAQCYPGSAFYHLGSKTQNLDPLNPACPPAQFEKNKAYYVKKWGGTPSAETFRTPFNDPTLTYRDVL